MMTAPQPLAQPAPPVVPTGHVSAQTVVRRILVYVILLALVVVAAIGLSGLLERVIGFDRILVADPTGLARSLAFTFIAGPLAGLLWWWQRRRFADPAERASITWALYVAVASTVALIVFTTALAESLSSAIEGEWDPESMSVAIVWAAVWVLHWLMHRSARISPTRLTTLPVIFGAVYGLALLAVSAVDALSRLISEALSFAEPLLAGSSDWSTQVLQALAWAALGALVWWWHWFRAHGREAQGPFATVAAVLVVGALTAVTLFAVGSILFVILRLLFDTDPIAEVLGPLDTAVATALVGGVLWVLHLPVLARRGDEAVDASRLVTSAVALIGAASGFGVVVNALLATFTVTLVDDDPRTLLLGGLSALVVGFPVWWLAWRPERSVAAEAAAELGRRVYLVVVFGASAVVAIVTLLLIGYRVFLYILDPGGFSAFVETIRVPFGLLSATAVVFAYHFAIWRHDRALARTVEAAPRPSIGRILLVAGADAGELAGRLGDELGVRVAVSRAQDAAATLDPATLPMLVDELRAVVAPRVLVVATGADAPRVIPLAD